MTVLNNKSEGIYGLYAIWVYRLITLDRFYSNNRLFNLINQ